MYADALMRYPFSDDGGPGPGLGKGIISRENYLSGNFSGYPFSAAMMAVMAFMAR